MIYLICLHLEKNKTEFAITKEGTIVTFDLIIESELEKLGYLQNIPGVHFPNYLKIKTRMYYHLFLAFQISIT